MYRPKLWFASDSGGRKKLIVDDEHRPISCDDCPCDEKCEGDCEEFVIATYTTNEDNNTWVLSPYRYSGKYACGARWKLYEKGAGLTYNSGRVGKDGELIGLPQYFVSRYSYNGYMVLEQYCEDE